MKNVLAIALILVSAPSAPALDNDLIGVESPVAVEVAVEASPLSYVQGRQLATKEGKDLVIGIACDPPAGPWVSAREEKPFWPGTQHWGTGVIVVDKNKGSHFAWATTLKASEATAERIQALLAPRPQVDRRQRVYYTTPLIAPRYKAAANC